MEHSWKRVPLGEIYTFSSGLSKPKAEFGFGHGFLTFKDVFKNFFVPDTLSELVNSTQGEQKKCSIKRGDVFLTRTSETMDELGMSCVSLNDYEKATFNGFTKRLRPRSEDVVTPEYAAFYFRSPWFRRDVTAMSSMSTRASLNNEMLNKLKIILPPLEVQAVIGNILKTLCDKIDLNQRMNETLEAMARAIFKSWFIDFDGHTEFEDSELGPIPKGWRVSEVGKEVQVVGGATPSTKNPDFWEGGAYHWATPKDLSALRSPVLLDTARKLTKAGVDKISSGVLPRGTLLLSSRAPIGYLAINEVPTAINQGFIAMKCEKDVSNIFMLFWCKENLDTIVSNANGSTFQEISKRNFNPIKIVVPPHDILQRFDAVVAPLFDKIVLNEQEILNLASVRDLLIPKLISGELPAPTRNHSDEEHELQ